MTKLDKKIDRVCPEITNEDGRELTVSLTPEDGGSMTLKWKGLGKAKAITAPLGGLIGFFERQASKQKEEPKKKAPEGDTYSGPALEDLRGVDLTRYCPYDMLKSRIHIMAEIPPEVRVGMIRAVDELQELQIYTAKL